MEVVSGLGKFQTILMSEVELKDATAEVLSLRATMATWKTACAYERGRHILRVHSDVFG